MSEDVQSLRATANSLGLGYAAEYVIDRHGFDVWSGSSKPHLHHYGKGGLAKHTREVVDLCLLNRRHIAPEVNEKELFLAALFHDVGKLWDYGPLNEEMTEWGSVSHKRFIHHISRSALIWQEAVTTIRFDNSLTFDQINDIDLMQDSVTHCILSHHGQREWGSPVSPGTRAAWILHLCDAMSARMNDCDKIEAERKSKW